MAEAYIVAAARTAGGRKGGRLAGWHPADLAASVLDTLVDLRVIQFLFVEPVAIIANGVDKRLAPLGICGKLVG